MEIPGNKEVYYIYKGNPNYENYQALNGRFREFMNYLILLRLLSVHIKYKAINYKKNVSKLTKELLSNDNDFSIRNLASTYNLGKNKQRFSWELVFDEHRLVNALEKLTHHQQLIIKKIFIEDQKISDISKDLGVSQQAISKTKKQAINKLKDAMGGGYI